MTYELKVRKPITGKPDRRWLAELLRRDADAGYAVIYTCPNYERIEILTDLPIKRLVGLPGVLSVEYDDPLNNVYHIHDTEHGQPQREADGDVLWA